MLTAFLFILQTAAYVLAPLGALALAAWLAWALFAKPPRPKSFLDKCKRRRIDGPTPCFCCAGECWGDLHDDPADPGLSVNASLASTADEIITLHRDGSVSRRRGPMAGC